MKQWIFTHQVVVRLTQNVLISLTTACFFVRGASLEIS